MMSYYRKAKIPPARLFFIALCAIAVIGVAEASKKFQEDPLLSRKIAAAQKMAAAMAAIKEEKLRSGAAINLEMDPNQTGLIGEEYNDLTTSLGSLTAKRTSTNPNFAGLLVELLVDAGLKPGDPLAAHFSGSFPALNTAVLSAISVLQLKPAIISSVGASTYGANEPDWTWLDMERVLREKEIFPYSSIAASLGGLVDSLGGREGNGTVWGRKAIERNQIPYLEEKGHRTLPRDAENRMDIYSRALGGRKPAAFINVGGSLISMGERAQALSISPGLSLRIPPSGYPDRGILFRMNEMGVPVIHLLNVKKLARRYGLPVDPIPLPAIPSGRVMEQKKYFVPVVLGGLILLALLLAVLRPYQTNTPVLK